VIDLSRVSARFYDLVTPVVDELVTEIGIDPGRILLVGAACRDILHAGFGHTFAVRATTDTDLGIAVDDWTISERIESRFRRTGSNGIRYRIAGTSVDIMPFGSIEDPEGVSLPAARGEQLVVFGFGDVYDRAMPLCLPDGRQIRLPQPAGYAALKLRSWIDRSVHYGHDKDAKDLALAAHWYQNSPVITERLYGSDTGFELLQELDFDAEIAATRLLAHDLAGQLSPINREDLTRRWAETDPLSLARDFVLPTSGPPSADLDRRRIHVAQLRW
jgi:predicted nucleotidyltransferase